MTTKAKKDHSHFIKFPHEIIDSQGFKELGNSARVALFLLYRQKGTKADTPSVKFPYKDARAYLNGATFSRAISDLVKYGFIDLGIAARIGSDIRQPNVYVFSLRWKVEPLPLARSRCRPNNRSMVDLKTGRFTPKIRTMKTETTK